MAVTKKTPEKKSPSPVTTATAKKTEPKKAEGKITGKKKK